MDEAGVRQFRGILSTEKERKMFDQTLIYISRNSENCHNDVVGFSCCSILVQGHEFKWPVLRRETFYTVCIIIVTSVELKKALRH